MKSKSMLALAPVVKKNERKSATVHALNQYDPYASTRLLSESTQQREAK